MPSSQQTRSFCGKSIRAEYAGHHRTITLLNVIYRPLKFHVQTQISMHVDYTCARMCMKTR